MNMKTISFSQTVYDLTNELQARSSQVSVLSLRQWEKRKPRRSKFAVAETNSTSLGHVANTEDK